MTNSLNIPEQDLNLNFETSVLIRGLDLIGSGLGLFLLVPVMLIIGLTVKFTSEGPIFHRMKRVGQGGHLFRMYKFRTIHLNVDCKAQGITLRNDPQITPVGYFLRHTGLNKLPQLINVFRGEMSLVGPRPANPRRTALYTPEQRQVLAVRPGLISPASLYYKEEEMLLSGDSRETVYREQILLHKLALDLAYLQQRTIWTDLALILRTISAIIYNGEGFNGMLKLRNRHLFLLDALALLLTPALALILRLDAPNWRLSLDYDALVFFTVVALLVKLAVFFKLKIYNRYWRYASVNDLAPLVVAVGISTTILTVLFVSLYATLNRYDLAMYRTVPLIDGLLTGLVVGGFRFGVCGLYHWQRLYRGRVAGRRVLVVGAGEAGKMVIREMLANPQLEMEPIAFVDDDPAKIGTQTHGLPVLGTIQNIAGLVDRYQIQRIIVAMPSVPLKRQQEISGICEKTGIATHIVPGVYEILAGHKTISRLPQIDIHHLLHREPVVIDQTEVVGTLKGAVVLVTGAGGSIGRELCRQIARFEPAEIILLGHGENSIFEIGLDLRLSFPNLVMRQVIVDVRDQQRVNWAVETYRPEVIFHAAAHKHVPFMETNVEEAITNNVLGTHNVLWAAEHYGVERFILISTDKAVNPTSIMGATKRLAELLMLAAAQRTRQAYIAVRFGNVLGSRGSVVPVFQRQIAAGGPLTITHPDMCRYFMTIPEAVQLVLQASVLGRGGEIFVLDMGQPVRILNLATDLIKLSGLEPGRDIKIVYSGIRPGEKLNEELFLERENYRHTKHSKIFVAPYESAIEAEALEQIVLDLISLTRQMHTRAEIEQMRVLIPKICYYIDKYQPQPRSLLPKLGVIAKSSSPDALYPRPSASAA